MHGLQVVLILLVGGLGKSNVCQHLLFSWKDSYLEDLKTYVLYFCIAGYYSNCQTWWECVCGAPSRTIKKQCYHYGSSWITSACWYSSTVPSLMLLL
jgi:hypothetical protein